MNATQLQKHYDKLTPRERLALQLEADARGDEREMDTLTRTAPKKTYDVGHHLFIWEAFRTLAYIHTTRLLNMAAAFYQGQGLLFLADHDHNPRYTGIADNLVELANTIVRFDASWRKFCEMVGINPEHSLLNIPGSGQHTPDSPLQSERPDLDTIPQLLTTARKIACKEPDPAEVEDLAGAYREVLYHRAGDQTGGWG